MPRGICADGLLCVNCDELLKEGEDVMAVRVVQHGGWLSGNKPSVSARSFPVWAHLNCSKRKVGEHENRA